MYDLYSPVIQKVETIRLERRLDEELYYLRDVPYEYQTYPQVENAIKTAILEVVYGCACFFKKCGKNFAPIRNAAKQFRNLT
jgi:hypothetical protein